MTSTVTEHTKSLLRAALGNAFRAGAEAMREAALDATSTMITMRYARDAIRNLPIPTMPQETPDV